MLLLLLFLDPFLFFFNMDGMGFRSVDSDLGCVSTALLLRTVFLSFFLKRDVCFLIHVSLLMPLLLLSLYFTYTV